MATTDLTVGVPSFLLASQEKQELAKVTLAQLHGRQNADQTGLSLSPAGIRILEEMLKMVADGQVVTGISRKTEMTIRQATELLCVSESHLLKLLDSKEIPSHGEGNDRKILLKDLLEYKETKKNLRLAVLAELVAESQAEMPDGEPD